MDFAITCLRQLEYNTTVNAICQYFFENIFKNFLDTFYGVQSLFSPQYIGAQFLQTKAACTKGTDGFSIIFYLYMYYILKYIIKINHFESVEEFQHAWQNPDADKAYYKYTIKIHFVIKLVVTAAG